MTANIFDSTKGREVFPFKKVSTSWSSNKDALNKTIDLQLKCSLGGDNSVLKTLYSSHKCIFNSTFVAFKRF